MLQGAASPSQIIVCMGEGGLSHQMLLIQSEYRFRTMTLEESRTGHCKKIASMVFQLCLA